MERMDIEKLKKNTDLKPMKRTRHVKTVKYLKIYERKNEPYCQNPPWDDQDQEKKQETEDEFEKNTALREENKEEFSC